MLHCFKLYGQRYAFDCASGAIHKLSELQYDMLRYLKLPFQKEFPSSLRYDLAKYESEKLKDAYSELAMLNADGVLMSDNPVKTILTEKQNRSAEKTVIYGDGNLIFSDEVIRLADSGFKTVTVKENELSPVSKSDYDILENEYERIAKEIIKRKTGKLPGKVFEFLPFDIQIKTGENGYTYVTDKDSYTALSENLNPLSVKISECASAVYLTD